MEQEVVILWLRNDLRLHDHEALHKAIQTGKQVLPVYCVDPRHWRKNPIGLPKTGAFRTRFLQESLYALRQGLRQIGGDLLIVRGMPETRIPELVEAYQAAAVFAHKEVTEEEIQVEAAVESCLFKRGVPIHWFWGSTLFHVEDLPMPVQSLPEVFTAVRKMLEKEARVRKVYPAPDRIRTPELQDPGEFPPFQVWGLEEPVRDRRSAVPFAGGEAAGMARLDHYFWETDLLAGYKHTRNGLLGPDYSSKFSPWLANGSLSPRFIYHQVKAYEKARKENASTYWLIFELIWRDFFRFMAKKHGKRLFLKKGLHQVEIPVEPDPALFQAWIDGETGFPFVDANMRELAATGFMSNRGRQNVASFLVKDLNQDWRWGAHYFESMLIDYDVCSNWGNWNYVAGTGNDPRKDRYFNVVSQASKYDPQGNFVRQWVPELAEVPGSAIHEPWENRWLLEAHGVSLGLDYPEPVISRRKQGAGA